MPADAENNPRDDERGDRVGQLQELKMPVFADSGRGQAEKHGEGGPHVRAEVDRIGFECGALRTLRDPAEVARARVVDRDGKQ